MNYNIIFTSQNFDTYDNHNKHRSFLPLSFELVLFLNMFSLFHLTRMEDTLTQYYPTIELKALFDENNDKLVYDEDNNLLEVPKLEVFLLRV